MNPTFRDLRPNTLQRWLVSGALFVVCFGFMVWLRLVRFPVEFVALTYALPLLVCLWQRDKILLWTMALGFVGLATYKSFAVMHISTAFDLLQYGMQLLNILLTAVTIQIAIHLWQKTKREGRQLEEANADLAGREEEISRQNEELHTQGEELAHQNEELECQAEELREQAEELQKLNEQVSQRECILQELLSSLSETGDQREILQGICAALGHALGPDIKGVAVVEKEGGDFVLQGWYGQCPLAEDRWPVKGSFSELITQQNRTATVELSKRPDLHVPACEGVVFRSVIGTPLRLKGRTVGIVKAYSISREEWTQDDFRTVEWMSTQCAMALEITRLTQQLRAFNAQLEATVERRTFELQEMVEDLEHFSYTITHDMRAPLRAIQGFAGMLEESLGPNLSSEAREWLDHLGRSAQRMDRLITDALSYSKAVQQDIVLHPVDAEALLKGIIFSYPALQPPKARISIDTAIPMIMANEAGLTQCFSNLLTNAVKFVASGVTPEVRISAETRGDFIRIWVADNGIGIPSQANDRLFRMFQRASKSYEGTGIGLALVRKVVTKMRGRVGFESAVGEGSRFWVELPAAASDPGGADGRQRLSLPLKNSISAVIL